MLRRVRSRIAGWRAERRATSLLRAVMPGDDITMIDLTALEHDEPAEPPRAETPKAASPRVGSPEAGPPTAEPPPVGRPGV